MIISEILILELYYTKTELNIYINSADYSLEKNYNNNHKLS